MGWRRRTPAARLFAGSDQVVGSAACEATGRKVGIRAQQIYRVISPRRGESEQGVPRFIKHEIFRAHNGTIQAITVDS